VFAIPGIGNAEGGRERVQNLGCDRFSDGLARWAPQSKHNQELGGGDSLIFELAGGAFVYPIPLYGELEAKLLNE
jgi:hypothetical protein